MVTFCGVVTLENHFTLSLVCDDSASVYVDGILAASSAVYYEMIRLPVSFTALLAIDCYNLVNEGGLVASIDSDDVSNGSWLCTKNFTSSWMNVTFDDSAWQLAKPIEQNLKTSSQASIFPYYAGVAQNADWINTDDFRLSRSHTYFRRPAFISELACETKVW